MSNIKIQMGHRVRAIGVLPTDDEYDVGEVIGVGPRGMLLVRWDVAGEVYPEDPETLEVTE